MAKPIRCAPGKFRIRFQPKGGYAGSKTGTYQECLDWFVEQKAAWLARSQPPARAPRPMPNDVGDTVREMIEKYRREIADLKSAKSTGCTLNSLLRTAAWVHRPAAEITEGAVEDWIKARLRSTLPNGELIEPSTMLFELGVWRRMFRIAARKGWCGLTRHSINPAMDVQVPKRNPEGKLVAMKVRDRLPTGEEWDRLIAAIRRYCGGKNTVFEDIVRFAKLSGFRRSECLRAKVGDIKGKIARLKLTKNGEDQKRSITPELEEWSDAYLRRRAEYLGRSLDPDEPLFPWYSSAEVFTSIFRRICNEAGIIGLQFRDLRAHFCTDVGVRTGNSAVAIKFSGHRTTRVFDRVYMRLTPEQASDLLRTTTKFVPLHLRGGAQVETAEV